MEQFLSMFIQFWSSLLGLLESVSFQVYGFRVSFLAILGAFFVTSFVVSVYWRGAKA